MRYAVVFALLALALAGSAARAGPPVAAVEVYLALGLMALAIAYGMKRAGFAVEEACCRRRSALAAWVLLAPYRLLGWLALGLLSRFDGEAAISRVAPDLAIGRRPSRAERRGLAGSGIGAVLDLCFEFPHPDWDSAGMAGRFVPILDGSPPSDRQFREALGWIEASRAEGKAVLIHCAQGHGRSATVAAVVLCRIGLADDVDRAIELIRSARPRARPSREQRSAAVRFLASIESVENAEGRAFPPAPPVESKSRPKLSDDR